MSTTSAHSISSQALVPVHSSGKATNGAAPGVYKSYEAAYRTDDKREDEGRQSSSYEGAAADAATNEEGKKWPEIFKLLEGYSFKDLLELWSGVSDSDLDSIIRKGREKRGVSSLVPVSSSHSRQKSFINEMTEKYYSTVHFMSRQAGQTHCGTL